MFFSLTLSTAVLPKVLIPFTLDGVTKDFGGFDGGDAHLPIPKATFTPGFAHKDTW